MVPPERMAITDEQRLQMSNMFAQGIIEKSYDPSDSYRDLLDAVEKGIAENNKKKVGAINKAIRERIWKFKEAVFLQISAEKALRKMVFKTLRAERGSKTRV